MTIPAQSGDNPVGSLSPLKRALLAVEEMQARVAQAERARSEPIAIVGMACRFPGAPDLDAFWRLLENAQDAVVEVPPERWALSEFFSSDVDAPGKMMTRWGGFLDQVDQFDPEFFGISPREAALMDPQQRLLLEVAWEALENGAQGPASWVNGKTGVFIGITGDEYAQRIFRSGDPALFNAYFASGIARSVAGGRISYTLGMEGPNFSIDTACSSSLVAVHNACVYLRTAQCRMALAGGVNVILSPEIGITFSKAHMMASDGRCKTFDARADGFVRAEGCGIVVLKRLSDALSDGDRILALIRGSAINQDGRSSGLTVPNVHAQESVMRDALAGASIDPASIGYMEAHGTGTELGDPIEAHALSRVFAPGRSPEQPLVVGSIKTNLGHLEAAAGIAGLMKTVLALQHQAIPANLHFQSMNPHINWGALPVKIPTTLQLWRKTAAPRRAGISAFGFSGTNAHVVLEEAPSPAERATVADRPSHVIALSARTPSSLRSLVDRYADTLAGNPAAPGDLAFSANAGRAHFAHRVAVTGSSAEEFRSKLIESMDALQGSARDGVTPVFLFPGQGAQYAGMGRALYDAHPYFRQSLDRCAELLRPELPVALTEVLWGNATHLLDETAYTQPVLFAVEYALAELWRSWGIEPAAVLGHSIGEYVAACIAGVCSLEDGLKLIAARARLMQAVAGQGAMTSALTSEEQLRASLEGLSSRVSIAAINAPESIVFSGYLDAVEIVESRLREQGVRVQRLKVSHAFHSPQMEEMADAFAAIAGGLSYRPPQIKWISSMTGNLMGRSDAADPAYWRRQVREPVRFRAAMETLDRLGHLVFLEVGPGTALSALGQQCIGRPDRLWLPSLGKGTGEWQQLLGSLARLYTAGADVDWNAFDQPYGRRRVQLPTYPFERQRYWFASPEPARPLTPVASAASAQPYAGAATGSLFDVAWEPVAHPAPSSQAPGDWLLIADRTGVAHDLSARLSAHGHRVSLMQPAQIQSAITAQPWSDIVFLPSLDAPEADQLTSESLQMAQHQLCGAALDLVHALASAALVRPPCLWLVTRGAQSVAQEKNAALAQSTLWGIAQAVSEEHPQWNCTCIDLDPARPDAAADLSQELLAQDSEDHIALRNAQRFAMRILPHADPPSALPLPIVPDATVLITGGFGALGRHVARWLVEHGARNLVLVSRREPPLAARELIEWATSRDARIVPYCADISRFADAERLMSEISATLPPLRGIVHAAGVLDDGILTEQTWERFAPVLAPKVEGSWNLHHLTRALPLDFFVMFSSLAAVAGAPGQANYAAANAFQDALASYRRTRGLPAVSIAWGAWADGMAAHDRLEERRRSIGIETMTAEQGLQLFAAALTGAPARVVAGIFDWDRFAARYSPRAAPARFSHLVSASPAAAAQFANSGSLRQWSTLSPSAGALLLRDYLHSLAVRVLGFPSGRRIDPAQPLQELGLDSLMAVELRNALSAALGQNLPATLLFSYPALDDLNAFIAGLLWGGNSLPPDQASVANAGNLLDRLEQLSDEELDRLLAEKSGASQ